MVDSLSAKIDMELGDSRPRKPPSSGRTSAWRSLALDRVIGLSYRFLGLISFFTAGPDETRAWPIPAGSTAVDAAGAIHSRPRPRLHPRRDLCLRGAPAFRPTAEANKHGKLRSEGKTYRVRDGDVIEILFSR